MDDKNILTAQKIAYEVSKSSGTAYYVGGYVRDLIRGAENKDVDIEIHGICSDKLEEILDCIGKRMEIGQSFGIYALKNCNLDIALPRKEECMGRGHRNFDIFTDPFIGTENAAKRRDFTMNSIMKNVLTGEITDHFGGVKDIENKVIRHINDQTFSEDSLRVLRAAQFAARFGFEVADETEKLCREISLCDLSKERVCDELKKALLKAPKPSVFFEYLRKFKRLGEWFVELENLIGVRQNPKYHPEGDVWTHTMITLDNAAKYRNRVSNPFSFMLSALCHDMGKPMCTKEIDSVIHSYGHEKEGVPVAEKFVKRLTDEKSVLKYVLNMTENHMRPYTLAANKSSVKATNKMFDVFVEPVDAIYFSLSDKGLRKDSEELQNIKRFLLERYDLYAETMRAPYVTGKDLINAGIAPGKKFKTALSHAHKLRLAGINKETALKETLAYMKSL